VVAYVMDSVRRVMWEMFLPLVFLYIYVGNQKLRG
jgi:hypothetical protein